MKTKLILVTLYLSTLAGYVIAQNPGFNYQAVLRNDAGEPMTTAEVTLHFSLIDGPSSTVIYRENQTLTTNELGILTCMIGAGTVESGTFAEITGVQDLNIKIEAELPGETGMIEIGESPIGIVPYALYGKDEDADPDNEMQELSLQGDSLMISNNGGVTLEEFKSPWKKTENGQGYELDFVDASARSIIVTGKIIKVSDNGKGIKESISLNLDGTTIDMISTDEQVGGLELLPQNIKGVLEQALDAQFGQNVFVKKITAEHEHPISPSDITTTYTISGLMPGSNLGVIDLTVKTGSDIIEYSQYLPDVGTTNGLINSTNGKKVFTNSSSDGNQTIELAAASGEGYVQMSSDGVSLRTTGIILDVRPKFTPDGVPIIDLKVNEDKYSMNYQDQSIANVFANGSFTYGAGYHSNLDQNRNMLYGTGRDGANSLAALSQWYADNSIYAQVAKFSGGGSFSLFSSDNNLTNYLGYIDQGELVDGLVGSDGSLAAYSIYANAKSTMVANEFAMPMTPPSDEQQITYSAIAGAECAAYERGTATLKNGGVTIECSNHFREIADPKSMTVILTPLSAESMGMAVVEKSKEGFRVKELNKGSGNYSFDWEVKCKRKGMEDFPVYRKPVSMKKMQMQGGGIKKMAHLRKTVQ